MFTLISKGKNSLVVKDMVDENAIFNSKDKIPDVLESDNEHDDILMGNDDNEDDDDDDNCDNISSVSDTEHNNAAINHKNKPNIITDEVNDDEPHDDINSDDNDDELHDDELHDDNNQPHDEDLETNDEDDNNQPHDDDLETNDDDIEINNNTTRSIRDNHFYNTDNTNNNINENCNEQYKNNNKIYNKSSVNIINIQHNQHAQPKNIEKRVSFNYLTKYEKILLLGFRTQQIINGSPVCINLNNLIQIYEKKYSITNEFNNNYGINENLSNVPLCNTSSTYPTIYESKINNLNNHNRITCDRFEYIIALEELKQNVIPFKIKRTLPNGSIERFDISELHKNNI